MMSRITRKKFIREAGLAALSLPVLSAFSDCNPSSKQNVSDMKNNGPDKLGIALVGLGNYAGILANALLQTEHCYLAGIVTGTPSKVPAWKQKYQIPEANIYSYANFETIRDNASIDIVYVVLPNSMHADYTIRAATAGKHVICEKPMAITVEDCNKMVEACNKAGKTLSIGYRLHFEPYNLNMQRLGRGNIYGVLHSVDAGFGFRIGDPTQWRLNKSLAGGGPLQDLGIYCIQGICYTTGLEPLAVTAQEGAKTDLTRFKEVEQSITFQMEMPGGIVCEGKASYWDSYNYLAARAEKGDFELRPAFGYGGQKGSTPEGEMQFPSVNQQAKQMDAIALAIKNKKASPVPGELGRRDVKIIQAVYESMNTGKKIKLSGL